MQLISFISRPNICGCPPAWCWAPTSSLLAKGSIWPPWHLGSISGSGNWIRCTWSSLEGSGNKRMHCSLQGLHHIDTIYTCEYEYTCDYECTCEYPWGHLLIWRQQHQMVAMLFASFSQLIHSQDLVFLRTLLRQNEKNTIRNSWINFATET